MNDILKICNLTKYYGKTLGVKNLNLNIKEGEIFGFIGPNGSGKSTTIRSIMNLINKNNGKIYIYDEELKKDDIRLKQIIGYLPSEIHLYDDLKVKEMLDYHENFYKNDIHNKRCELVKLLKLDETKKIEDLSLGNLKKLGIVLAIMHSPKILILDEATSGLDPITQQTFYELLKKEKENGTTIFYSTHILSEISKICDRVGIIKNGELLKIETVKDLLLNQLTYVTVVSKDTEKIVKDLKIEPITNIDNMIKFKNNIDYNDLIKKLAKYEIEKILIEEATLEDILFDYYR